MTPRCNSVGFRVLGIGPVEDVPIGAQEMGAQAFGKWARLKATGDLLTGEGLWLNRVATGSPE